MAVTFRTKVERTRKTATFLSVPNEVVASLDAGKRPPVLVTVGPHTFRSTIAVYASSSFLPLNRANREAARVSADDEVAVTIDLDVEPRVVDAPEDLAAALADDQPTRQAFEALSSSHQREYVEWVTEAKRPETRTRRIAGTLQRVRDGQTAR